MDLPFFLKNGNGYLIFNPVFSQRCFGSLNLRTPKLAMALINVPVITFFFISFHAGTADSRK